MFKNLFLPLRLPPKVLNFLQKLQFPTYLAITGTILFGLYVWVLHD